MGTIQFKLFRDDTEFPGANDELVVYDKFVTINIQNKLTQHNFFYRWAQDIITLLHTH